MMPVEQQGTIREFREAVQRAQQLVDDVVEVVLRRSKMEQCLQRRWAEGFAGDQYQEPIETKYKTCSILIGAKW
jgi:hypothetical protein